MREREWLTLTETRSMVGELIGPLSDDDVWREVRGAGADGLVRIRGARQERRGNNPLWSALGDACLIPPEAIEALWPVVWRDGSLVLVNEEQARQMKNLGALLALTLFPAVAWTSVSLSRSDIERAFPPAAGGTALPMIILPNRPGPQDMGEAIRAARQAAFPDGVPEGTRASVEYDKIRKQLRLQGVTVGVSDRSMQRHLRGKSGH
jgi:hypothetical protein